MVVDTPITVTSLRDIIFNHISESKRNLHNITRNWSDTTHILLVALEDKIDRKKPGASLPKIFYPCEIIPDTTVFTEGADLDLILMLKTVKSFSTKSKGGSGTDPSSVVRSVLASFIAEQVQKCKMGNPLHNCYSHISFIGTSIERQRAITDLTHLSCAGLNEEANLALPGNCTGAYIAERYY